MIREKYITCDWYKEVWYKYATTKYFFILWTAMKERLATGDRMRHCSGSVDSSCVLCNEPLETMEHLFFECVYTAQIWKKLMEGVLQNEYTNQWRRLMRIMRVPQTSKLSKVFHHQIRLSAHSS